ncbi:protein-export chaperone SecB [Streptococcus anginosus]|uniref:protein-export chaperone SecB n=1 Tax=Streptococcus anginosus TaxID=1328 RepID=UPI00195A2BCA|nr:protein-export chaperone SecB [Streptococcus anginosus]QRR97678.1 protein-export chaperone SecB [Streptococcus anginosus]DAE65982.1 MAG TPA: Protein-export protein secB, Greek key beta sheet.35A [Caudoviricetes sp.]
MSTNSELILQNVRVKSLNYLINEAINISDIKDIDISILPTPRLAKDDIHSGIVELSVELFDKNFIENNKPFHIEIVVQGIFTDTDKTSELDIFEKYFPNMISMIYPYIRSYISATTGMFGIQNVQIPAINVFKLLEELYELNNKK